MDHDTDPYRGVRGSSSGRGHGVDTDPRSCVGLREFRRTVSVNRPDPWSLDLSGYPSLSPPPRWSKPVGTTPTPLFGTTIW